MDKSQEASAPPNTVVQEAPPPYPGNQPGQEFPGAGGFQAPQPAGPILVANAPFNSTAPSYAHPPPGTAIPPVYQQPIPAQQVMVQAPIAYGKDPVSMKCFHCGAQIQTSTESSPGAMAWMACGALAFAGCFVGVTWLCCCIPFCIPGLQDVKHTCPNKECRRFLGTYKGTI